MAQYNDSKNNNQCSSLPISLNVSNKSLNQSQMDESFGDMPHKPNNFN